MSELLRPEEISRYARQIALPELGLEGQQRLKAARVAIVGAGGLGSPVATYLAAAGVGTLAIVDGDAVDRTNLHRQLLYGTGDIGARKVAAAAARLHALNPNVSVHGVDAELTRDNAMDILRGYQVVVDGTDNFRTRYLINDACVLLGIPNVYGSVLRFDGQVSVLATPNGPCYRCLYPVPPPSGSVPSCAEAGVLGVLPGLVGTLQGIEAIKLIVERGEPLIGRLLLIDALAMQFTSVNIKRDPACVACGTRELQALPDYEAFCSTPPTGSASVEHGMISARELEAWRVARRGLTLLDVRERWEWDLCHIAGATLMPLGELAAAAPTLDRQRATVVYCHHGARGIAAAARLTALGFERVYNLAGGIDAWSAEVDPRVPRY